MIECVNVSKRFEKTNALDEANCTVDTGSVFGLVGSNGAGKSTLLRLISGIYKPDGGMVSIDGESVYDNVTLKKQCVFISDDPYLMYGASLNSMAKLYSAFYDTFSYPEYSKLVNLFDIDPAAQLSDFSKGMRRQAVIILALSCKSRYLFLDETLDGLDPVMRALVKKLLYQSVLDNNTTIVISSHSLRELEDACDNLAMIHKGKIVFQRDIEHIASSVSKVQVVLSDDIKKQEFAEIDVLNYTRKGSVANLIVRGKCDEVIAILEQKNPLLLEVLPLSLEEVFTYELRQQGYSFDEILKNGGDKYEK